MNIHSVFNIVVKKFFLLSFERNARTAVRIRMNDTQTHAFPSDPEGYQPQQGLTKREHVFIEMLKSITTAQFSEDWSYAQCVKEALTLTLYAMDGLANLNNQSK